MTYDANCQTCARSRLKGARVSVRAQVNRRTSSSADAERFCASSSISSLISFVERKGDNPITIGLHPDLADWIAQNVVGDDPRGFVFPSLANRSGAGRNGLSKYFEGIMKKAGIEARVLRNKDRKGRSVRSLSFHSFRHGAASAAFKGAALKNIARSVTGHAAKGVVDRYIHIDVEALMAATELIPRLQKK